MASRDIYKMIPHQDLEELKDFKVLVNKAYTQLECTDDSKWDCNVNCKNYMVCKFYQELLNKLDDYTLLGEFINSTK